MACPVLISPACVVAGKVVGAVAGTAASGALNGIAAAIESGITWMVTQTSTWWVQIPSPDLSGEPASPVVSVTACRARATIRDGRPFCRAAAPAARR